MKRLLYLVCLVGFVSACGPKEKLPEGAPEPIKQKELLENIEEQALQFDKLRLSGKGSYQDDNNRQNFRFDIRLLNDSLVWVTLSDPLLGIKVARGQVEKGSLSYYNALDQSYFKGSPQELQKRFGFSFEFHTLFPLLSANLISTGRDLKLNYAPGNYLLMDYDPSGESMPDPTQETFSEFYLSPDLFRPQKVVMREPVNGRVYTVTYHNYRQEEPVFPRKITLEYQGAGGATIELNIDRVEKDQEFNFPYKIPGGYEQKD